MQLHVCTYLSCVQYTSCYNKSIKNVTNCMFAKEIMAQIDTSVDFNDQLDVKDHDRHDFELISLST